MPYTITGNFEEKHDWVLTGEQGRGILHVQHEPRRGKPMGESRLLRTIEIADRFGVSQVTIQRWIQAGFFPNAYKTGPYKKSPYVIPEDDVIAFEAKYRKGNHKD